MRIKLMPETERPLEKALDRGIKTLSNTEILAIIIHTGTKNKSAIHLAEEVLTKYPEGIAQLGESTLEDLTEIVGIGSAKALNILAAIELGKRISTGKKKAQLFVESSDDVAKLFMEELRFEKKEHFKSVMVNAKGRVIGIDNVSIGELSSTVVHPREVFIQAVKKSAAGVIFVHNHPSGDPSPSQEDILTTKRLIECGDVLGIKVLDHIIIGDGKFKSFMAMDLIK